MRWGNDLDLKVVYSKHFQILRYPQILELRLFPIMGVAMRHNQSSRVRANNVEPLLSHTAIHLLYLGSPLC